MDRLGIDIGGTQTKWAVVSEDYEIIERGWVPTDYATTDEEMAALDGIVRPRLSRVGAIGVSVPGTVPADDSDGTIMGGGALLFNHEFALGRAMREAYGLPVCVENDGKACALGEYASGALKGCRSGVVVVIGTGIGGGIVVDGRLLRGAHGFAGELSFLGIGDPMTRDGSGSFAGIGGWRHLRDLVLREKGLVDAEGRATDLAFDPDAVDGRKVFEWVNAGDEDAARGLDRYAAGFCSYVFDIQAMVDPEVIAIGGGMSAQPALLAALQVNMARLMERIAFLNPPAPRIVRTQNGNDANLFGAIYECRAEQSRPR